MINSLEFGEPKRHDLGERSSKAERNDCSVFLPPRASRLEGETDFRWVPAKR